MRPQAVILAAGAGSRLGELGRRHSKAMLPIAGKPLIAWVVERLRAAGAGDLIAVGHPTDTALADYLAAQEADGARLVQQRERRGIADALRVALPHLRPGEGYLTCACDSIFEVADISAVIQLGRTRGAGAVVGVLEMSVEATVSRSAVRVDGDVVTAIIEKPRLGTVDTPLVSMPLYWLTPAITPYLDILPSAGEAYVSTALDRYIRGGGTVLSHPVRGRLEITTQDDIAAVERALRA